MQGNQAANRLNGERGAQDALIQAMRRPDFYPKPPAEVTHKETHTSHLFFAGDVVYKIKKAVRYSFLDYSTLGKRRYFLNEELRLNRRLAPSVYLAVVPITFVDPDFQIAGDGCPIEYALIMRRLPERRMLPFLLETGQMSPEIVRELADALGKFHAQAEVVARKEPSRYLSVIEKQWNDNLSDLQPFIGELVDAETFESIKNFGVEFLNGHAELLIRRAEQGWIRDVHGDLHCEHVCFAPEGIQIFDCIEFSSELRCCDLASEIAFFLMDLEVRGGGAWVQPFLARYRKLLDDPEMSQLLPFYECYRALVRFKVHALRADGTKDAATRYLRFAGRFPWQRYEPFLLIVCGLTGSGKSTLARELSDRVGLPVINSDTVRKEIAEKSGRQIVSFNEGIYNLTMTEKTHARMAREAGRQILTGTGAILDATFGQKAHREKISKLAAKHKIPLLLIHCVPPEETSRKRLDLRAKEGKDVSDGRWEIFGAQKAAYQPITEVRPGNCLELNTDSPIGDLARASEKFLRARLEHPRG